MRGGGRVPGSKRERPVAMSPTAMAVCGRLSSGRYPSILTMSAAVRACPAPEFPSHRGCQHPASADVSLRLCGGQCLGTSAQAGGQLLVGTWQAATWAIRFYKRHGFGRVPDPAGGLLLRRYWTISERQIETSVVLAAPAVDAVEPWPVENA
jgi:hypothetical protein